ncbi:unnamed protein product [Lactuca virosa]|uniref:H(+)-exporting diphosphatase n=1 Tax=Lactuca virosa TaxID=75947 RepID=A0AAU9PVI8_9ASTR|nr:unnamed protein product [Lactuca virosa]
METNLKKADGNADCHHPRRPTVALQLPSAPTERHHNFVASSFGLAKPQRSSLFPSFSSFSAVPIDRIVAHRRRKPTARRSPSITGVGRRCYGASVVATAATDLVMASSTAGVGFFSIFFIIAGKLVEKMLSASVVEADSPMSVVAGIGVANVAMAGVEDSYCRSISEAVGGA